LNNCTNCNNPVDRENAILCSVCNVKYSDLFPNSWTNQTSLSMRFGFSIRLFAITTNFLFLMIGMFWFTGMSLPFIGLIPESIGTIFLIGGLVGVVACMVCYN